MPISLYKNLEKRKSLDPRARSPCWNQAIFNMKTFRSAGTNTEEDVVCILRTTDKQLRKSRVKAPEHAFKFLGFSFESMNRRPKESKLSSSIACGEGQHICRLSGFLPPGLCEPCCHKRSQESCLRWELLSESP